MERPDVTEAGVERTAPIDVVLIAEQLIVREGLRKILEGDAGFRVVADAADADRAIALVAGLRPDVVVVSLSSRRFPRTLRPLLHMIGRCSHARTILMTT